MELWIIPFAVLFIASVVSLLLRSERRVAKNQVQRPPRARASEYVAAQLIYRGGDWDSNAGALEALCRFYRENVDASVRFQVRPGVPGRSLAGVAFLFATGHFGFDMESADVQGLIAWAEAGGTGLIEDNNGMDAAFREFLRGHEMELSSDVDSMLFREPFPVPGGRMPKIMHHAGKPPALYSIVMNGKKTRLYYSFSADLGDGWEPGDKHGVSADIKEMSLRMGSNLLHHAIRGNV